jgi:hypothetical protein
VGNADEDIDPSGPGGGIALGEADSRGRLHA